MLANPKSLAQAILIAQEKNERGTLQYLNSLLNAELMKREMAERKIQEATNREMVERYIDVGLRNKWMDEESAKRYKAASRAGVSTLVLNTVKEMMDMAYRSETNLENKRRWEEEFEQKERLAEAQRATTIKTAEISAGSRQPTPEKTQQALINVAWEKYYTFRKIPEDMMKRYLIDKTGTIPNPELKVQEDFARLDPESARLIFPHLMKEQKTTYPTGSLFDIMGGGKPYQPLSTVFPTTKTLQPAISQPTPSQIAPTQEPSIWFNSDDSTAIVNYLNEPLHKNKMVGITYRGKRYQFYND